MKWHEMRRHLVVRGEGGPCELGALAAPGLEHLAPPELLEEGRGLQGRGGGVSTASYIP